MTDSTKKATRPLTDNQNRTLSRIVRNGGVDYISPELARQLERRGLVNITGLKRARMEYNQPVKGSTLWQVRVNG